tara:strand:- start:253 stop:726 length:474 start_codon:yes stop_codon:yes gene_type:complete
LLTEPFLETLQLQLPHQNIDHYLLLPAPTSPQYTIKSDIDTETNIIFSVYNQDDTLISEKSQETTAKKDQSIEGEISLDISNAKTGLLKVSARKSEEENAITENSIIYDTDLLTGFSVRGLLTNRAVSISLILILTLIPSFFIIRRILRLKKKRKKK